MQENWNVLELGCFWAWDVLGLGCFEAWDVLNFGHFGLGMF